MREVYGEVASSGALELFIATRSQLDSELENQLPGRTAATEDLGQLGRLLPLPNPFPTSLRLGTGPDALTRSIILQGDNPVILCQGGVGQAKGPELEAGMEPSPGTIIGSRYKVQKGALGHTLPAAAVSSSV